MFDRFVRLAQARKALHDGHFDRALRLVEDPLVQDHRKAEALRSKALDGLVDRARRRAEAGGLSAAFADCERALVARPDHGPAIALRDELRRRMEDGAGRAESVRSFCRDARRALERGDLSGASAMCDAAARLQDGAQIASLRERVRVARERARALLEEASVSSEAGRHDLAVAALRDARAQDSDLEGASEVAGRLARARAAGLQSELAELQEREGVPAARALWLREIAALPELSDVPALASVARRFEQDSRRRVVDLLEAGDVEGAVAASGSLDGRVDSLGPVVEQLSRALALAERGELAEAADVAGEIAEELGVAGLSCKAREWRDAARDVDDSMRRARAAALEGRLIDARGVLLEVLAAHPGHVAARREVEMLEQGAQDREARLAEARSLSRDGKLSEAAARIVMLAVPGSQGDEPRVLMRDLQQRMDTVQAGIRQVLRALHGRDSATREGLQHCLRRLEALRNVQSDAEDLERLKSAIEAELRGMDELDAASRALSRDDAVALGLALSQLAGLREQLLAADRLDARALEVVDDVLAEADRRVRSGFTQRGAAFLDAIAAWASVRVDVEARTTELRAAIDDRRRTATEHAERVQAALAARDLAAAEEALERAREAAADEASVIRAADAIALVRTGEDRLVGVRVLADRRDYDGAQRELGRLGPTPSLLRTRIYDLKKNLARAQGLEGAFLLRVDEGGEYLVVRSETVTIGNLRDGTSDLPLLASLAGRHARLRRTLSFHGGQEDRLIAERGDVWIAGAKVTDVRLADRTRFRLGEIVEVDYRLPSERSLTAVLRLRGGFQVAGTDTVLWMKDRGRDGRILLGTGPDVHVQVPGMTAEIEVFAGRDGQIRVHSASGGSIDGRPFQGEHPIPAGAIVEAGGASFVLLPWSRA